MQQAFLQIVSSCSYIKCKWLDIHQRALRREVSRREIYSA